MRRLNVFTRILAAGLLLLDAPAVAAQTAPTHGVRPRRLAIRNAMVIEGNGTPAEGPKDIILEGNRIIDVVSLDPVAVKMGEVKRIPADVEIDATGKYVMPGLINLHGHVQDERGGIPQPLEYQLKLWLGMGITSVRDVSSETPKTLQLRTRSAAGEVAAPRLYVYARYAYMPVPKNEVEARQRVRDLKAQGVDGLKLFGMDKDVYAPVLDEAKKLGLRTAHHMAVDETNAWDAAKGGLTSIEHWYGVPDAALLSGAQQFPSNFNYADEGMRFRYAGRLWREADPARLQEVLKAMVQGGVAWNPTLDIYEASRDLQRAETQPWFTEYLHPTLEKYFRPDAANHGSYFANWSSTDEAFWKENYQIWFRAVRDFERLGGVIGAGEDAGFIYQVYGFGLVRELELHQEAGFSTLKVLQHVTANNAKILGEEQRLGRIRAGFLADLVVVNGNPLEDLKALYPQRADAAAGPGGGVQWTIKDGIPYDAPRMLSEVRALVKAARTR
ncbi:amidohydrolase family protein [Gemmatimonas phototrophica]|uniref:amidohydrolase family protein n=1 Tax=Gemmatimonas phototrophica TaxID=1379270 RepID=UPI0006A70A91|nr:amidohydrolase family protein [Gemmatimonas phototrophica]